MPTSNDLQGAAILRHAIETDHWPDGRRCACLLCGFYGEGVIGFWQANEEIRIALGQPAGKTRIILYKLCDSCRVRSQACEQVEKRICNSMQGQVN